MTIGAVSGGVLMKIGRRRAQFVSIAIGIVGVLITMFFNMGTIIIGRIILGYSVGLLSTIIGRVIEETVPTSMHEMMSTYFYMMQGVGIMVAYGWALYLPDDHNIHQMKTTNRWRAIWVYFPIGYYLLYILLLLFYLKYDSLKFLINKNSKEEALKAVC